MMLVCLSVLEFFLIKGKLQYFPSSESDRGNSDTDDIRKSDVVL